MDTIKFIELLQKFNKSLSLTKVRESTTVDQLGIICRSDPLQP